MTTTRSPLPAPDRSAAPPPVPDHRPGLRTRALVLAAGGVLFAVGNALHPLTHEHSAMEHPTWGAAHVVFAVGALLIAAAGGVLPHRLAASRVAITGLGITWVGLVLMPVSSFMEVSVKPAMDHADYHALEQSVVGFSAVAGIAALLGPVLMALGAVRHRLLPVWVALGLLGTTAGLLVSPALPAEGYGIIPGTVVFGLSIAAAGWLIRETAG